MNKVCFPVGLNIKDKISVNSICINKPFDIHIERRILNKVYCDETKSKSLKNIKKKRKRTKKNYS